MNPKISTDLKSVRKRPQASRLLRAGVALVVLLVGAGIGWAAAIVLTPPRDTLDSTSFTYVQVVRGDVGSSINLNTVAEWTPIPVGANLSSGTVTSIAIEPGQEVGPGSVLYTVNLRPVIVAQGAIPAFQTLARGIAGADVAQLQSLLASLGFYTYAVDGKYDAVTEQAVEDWQESLGIEADGVVQAGDVIFVPSLPTRISLDLDKVKRGAILSPGDEVVRGLPPAPTFTVPVTETQAALMPNGTRVEITGPSGEKWDAAVVDQKENDQSGVTVELAGPDGGAICANSCTSIPVSGDVLLRSKIVTVETVTGLTVPSAALISRADGSLAVIDEKGKQREVALVTSARGVSVITGVPDGTLVRVPASEG